MAGKSEHLHMRVAPELKERLTNEAKRMHVDVSALVSMVLSDWLEKRQPPPQASNGNEQQ